MRAFRFNTLSSRLTVTTSLVTIVLFSLIALYILSIKSDEIGLKNKRDVELNLSNTSLTINKCLMGVESTLRSNAWLIDKCISLDLVDSIPGVLGQVLAIDPHIYGCGVAVSGAGDDIVLFYQPASSVASDNHFTKNALANVNDPELIWIRYAMRVNRDCWSVPHAAPYNSDIRVCSYSMPITTRSGKNAIFFADIPSDLLDRLIASNLDGHVVEAALIDAVVGERCICSVPNRMSATVPFDFSTDICYELFSQIGDSMPEGRHDMAVIKVDGLSWRCYYTVVNNMGWVLVFVANASDAMFSGTDALRIGMAFLFCVIVLYIVLSVAIKRLTRPLRLFSDSAIEISKGNFNVELPKADTAEEMALLHDSFETMQRSLVKYISQLESSTRSQTYIKGELQIAGRIQDDLLPKAFPPFPGRDDINVRAVLIPAKEIGGDLYNYFISDEKLYFIIADVSGKSVPAAIVMAIACNVFNTVAPHSSDPASIMKELNATTCANNEHSCYFITALVGILDLSSGHLLMCNAGHVPFLMVSPTAEVSLQCINPNLPVGVIPNFDYKSVALQLFPGSRLVMCTDGITEAESDKGVFFGLEGLEKVINDNVYESLAQLVEHIVSAVMEHTADKEQADDLTLLALDYNPSEVKLPVPLSLAYDMAELTRVRVFAEEISKALGFEEALKIKLNLVLEEAVTNVISHSVPMSPHNTISVFASLHYGVLSVTVSDIGKKFDPTQIPQVDTSAPIDRRQVGGLGIPLMREITTSMHYNYLNGKNCLTLRISV